MRCDGWRRQGPRDENGQVEERGAEVRAVRPLLRPDLLLAVDRPRTPRGPRRLPGMLGVVLSGGAIRPHPRRQARRAECYLHILCAWGGGRVVSPISRVGCLLALSATLLIAGAVAIVFVVLASVTGTGKRSTGPGSFGAPAFYSCSCFTYKIMYNTGTPTRAVNRGACLAERATQPEG